MSDNTRGHNSALTTISVEVRLFNSIASAIAGDAVRRIELPAGSDVGDVLRRLELEPGAVFLVFINGRDVSPALDGGVNTARVLDHGDTVALSGPVPYSWGYGAPVV